MSMFGPRPGTWYWYSPTDKRWNCSGHVERMIVTAGIHPDAQRAYDECHHLYGEPPNDLEYSCMKD